jgi:indolepyruvate ferredoxin oxidoreductase
VATVEAALGYLYAGNLAAVVEVARLPELVRGHERSKLDKVAAFRARSCELLADLA